MKKWLFLFVSLFFLFSPHMALADSSWTIENFHSDIAIQQSGKVRVVETISVDFRNQLKHGIYRDIPYLYENNGKETYTDVTINSVLQNNDPAHYTVSQTNGYKELQIGEANTPITGRNVYTITYTVTGVLRGFSDHDELYWNVTGNNWEVPIQKAIAVVTLPNEGITQITCFEGATGSQISCLQKLASPQLATFATTNVLAPSEGLTLAVAYKKGLIPLLVAQKPKTFLQRFFTLPSLFFTLLLALLGVGFILLQWYRYGRDYWFGGALFGQKYEKGKAKPIGAPETITVEFTPPEKLRPAEIGVLLDERADTLDVVATMIDLATRGYLTITEIPKKWLFGKVDYLLIKTTPKARGKRQPLLSYEQLLLDKLFYRRSQIKTSSLKTTFYDDLDAVKQALYNEVVAKGLFPENPEIVRSKYLFMGMFVLITSIIVIGLGVMFNQLWCADIGAAGGLNALVLVIIAKYMPHKTAYGRELLRRSRGYYLFINKAETYRQRFFEKKNMFNEVMPYAIMFGLTKKFATQMHDMGFEPKQTSWYISSHPFNSLILVASLTNFSSSMSTAIASTPSSSGGFSDGGGFSGGGFGGGGGGSW